MPKILSKKYDFEEIPSYSYTKRNIYLERGYISPKGEIYKCQDDYDHKYLCKKIVYDTFLNDYINLGFSKFKHQPYGMLQEEYFLMKYKSFIKISSYKDSNLNQVIAFYNTLTPEQTEIIYPK